LPVNAVPIIYDIIANEKFNRRNGFHFMEKVAVKYRGTPQDKYISNYTLARVYTSTEDGIYVSSAKGIRMLMQKDSIIKFWEFQEMRKQLLAEGKKIDPQIRSEEISMKQRYGVLETLDEVYDREEELDHTTDHKLKKIYKSKKLLEDVDTQMKAVSSKLGRRIKDPEADDLDTRRKRFMEQTKEVSSAHSAKKKIAAVAKKVERLDINRTSTKSKVDERVPKKVKKNKKVGNAAQRMIERREEQARSQKSSKLSSKLLAITKKKNRGK